MITISEFVKEIYFAIDRDRYEKESDLCLLAYENLLIENQDYVYRYSSLDKKTMARISHMFLKKLLQEADEPSIKAAEILKDLYDCHVCVNHIGQMYVKGIIEPIEPTLFGNEERVSKSEAFQIITRLLHKDFRKEL